MASPGTQNQLDEQQRRRLKRVSIGNIVTGNDGVGQGLPEDSPELKQLSPYTSWVEHGLDRTHYPVDKVAWFGKVVHYFSNATDAFIVNFAEENKGDWPTGTPGTPTGNILDFTLEALSYWLTIEQLHQILPGRSKTEHVIKNVAADLQGQGRTLADIREGKVRVTELVRNGQLIPQPETNTDPFKQIDASSLNAYRLMRYGRLRFRWTTNISQHLSLMEDDRVVMVFCLPSLITVQNSFETPAVAAFRHYIADKYGEEVRHSYYLLFGGKRQGRRSLTAARKSDPDNHRIEHDDVLDNLSTKESKLDTVWARENFPHLWPRIRELKNYLDRAEPEDWWGWILYNRSQPYVWVPILVSGIVLLLTLASTGATIAQTWKAFNPGGPTGPAPTTSASAATPTPRIR